MERKHQLIKDRELAEPTERDEHHQLRRSTPIAQWFERADKALRAALAVNATIYSVDMSAPNLSPGEKAQNRAALSNFADKTGGQYISTPGGVAMRDAFRRIVEELGVQYTIAYAPANTKKDGKWRSIELRVARPNLTIRTRKGYNAPKAETRQ